MQSEPPIFRQVHCRHGDFFVNVNDTYVGRSLDLYGEWSEAEIALFRQFVNAGDTLIEAGANIGSHTVWLSRQVGDDGRLFAFEPARHTFQTLCANLIANQRLNVVARQQGLGAAPGVLAFPYHDPRHAFNFGGASFYGAANGAEETVEIVTIDSLNLDRQNFLKADVEGFEVLVLEGASRTISNHRPVIYVEVNTAAVRDGIVALLAPLGYACHYYITPMFEAANWKGCPEDIFQNYSFDMICTPQDRFAVDGLPSASIDDRNLVYTDTQRVWASHDWRHALVTRI